MMENGPIGCVYGTETDPTSAYEFNFWAEKGAPIGIGTIVKVLSPDEDITVYGTVVEAHAYNDAPNALSDYLGSQRNPAARATTKRPEIRTFRAAVLRREPEEPIGAVPIGQVYFADAEAVQTALHCDNMALPIPVGVYGDVANPCPVLADVYHLLGTESAHLNVTGTSGLAAKTSYILFLLTSIFQELPQAQSAEDASVAAVIFNVKGSDLLFLDQPAERLEDVDKQIYAACGLEPKPFEKVEYRAPYLNEDRADVASKRTHEALSKPKGFCFGPEQVLQHIEVLINKDDVDAKADAILARLQKELKGGASSLGDLTDLLEQWLDEAEQQGGSTVHGHHTATIRKVYNRLVNLPGRFGGLIADRGAGDPPLPEKFENGAVYVIDVAELDADQQEFVFAAVISDLRKRMEEGADAFGVRRLIVVVDELNKFAPSSGSETYTVRALRDIAARGRYQGLILFGAQQFRSRVDPQIIGNCANSAYGHILMEELASPIYSAYSKAVRERLANCHQGEVMFRHPHFSQPVFLRFPRPPVLKGEDGLSKFPPERLDPEGRLIALCDRHGVEPAETVDAMNRFLPEDPEARDKAINAVITKIASHVKRKEAFDKSTLRRFLREEGEEPARDSYADAPLPKDPEDPFAEKTRR